MVKACDYIVFKPTWTIVKYYSKSQEKMRLLHDLLHYKGLSIKAVEEVLGERPIEILRFTGRA
jgi:hypothetical protein